jgi:hypothetical protein
MKWFLGENHDPSAAERDRLRGRFGLSAPRVDDTPTVAVTPKAESVWDPGFLSQQPWTIIAAFSVLEVCLVTVVGSWIAQRLGFAFAWMTPIAGLVYGAAGFASAAGGHGWWMAVEAPSARARGLSRKSVWKPRCRCAEASG